MNKLFCRKTYLIISFLTLTLFSCTSVKPWQKMYVNDADMKLSQDKLEIFESNFQSYREGATGAEGGSSGGGCGCN